MKIKVTLSAPGGLRDSVEHTLREPVEDPSTEISAIVEEFIDAHIWATGDVLTVEELK